MSVDGPAHDCHAYAIEAHLLTTCMAERLLRLKIESSQGLRQVLSSCCQVELSIQTDDRIAQGAKDKATATATQVISNLSSVRSSLQAAWPVQKEKVQWATCYLYIFSHWLSQRRGAHHASTEQLYPVHIVWADGIIL